MTRVLLAPDLPLERWPSMDRYALRLVRGLADEATDLDIAVATGIDPLTADEPSRMHEDRRRAGPTPFVPAPGANEMQRYLARYVAYPQRLRRQRADVVHVLDHSYAHLLRAKKRVPSLVTVHDLLPVLTVQRRAASVRDRIRNGLLRWVLNALREADGWIVATEWLKGELAEWLGDERGIHVIPFGVDDAFFTPADTDRQALRATLDVPAGAFVVLHVGSVGPRKNINAVVAALDGLRAANIDAWLLQVGGQFTPEQHDDIGRRGLTDVIRAVGSADESTLRAAYRATDVLLFPSHYEGFGFPVLEAMASELPVVTSGAGGLTEVSGEAAVCVGGREVDPYVSALTRIAGDTEWRADLIRRGVERARAFRWTETARQTADLYRRLGAN